MKKVTTIFMTLIIMLVVVLSGCSTFTIDKVKYYNEIVARVGEHNITRFELIEAYNNYGYTNYVTQQGKSEKEALIETMNSLVERKLVVNHAKAYTNKYQLSEYEVKKVFRDTLDYLLQSFNSNKDTARKIYNLEAKEESSAEDTAEESIKISDYYYQKRVEVQNGQLKFIDTDLEKDADVIKSSIHENYSKHFRDYSQDEIVTALLNQFKKEFYFNEYDEDSATYRKVCDKAIELACKNLINYEYYVRENGERLSTKQQDVLFRFVEKNYVSQLENAYIKKVNNVYLMEEQLSNDEVVNTFKALYQRDYAKYANNPTAYNEAIKETSSDLIYYAPSTDAEFGYFLHVLLPFNNVEEDLKWLKEHRHLYTDEQYKAEQEALINDIECKQRTIEEVRDAETGELINAEGVVLDTMVDVNDVLNRYRANVTDLNSFVKFMFEFTTDTATLTADMPYVIGYEGETKYSAMVENFTDEAIRLMKENKRYTEYNEYILTNYGIHLLYYVGPVVNQIAIEDINSLTIQDLNNAILNKATGETYLDRVFDLVYPAGSDGMFTTNTDYSQFEENLVNSLYSVYPVTLYETKIHASSKV